MLRSSRTCQKTKRRISFTRVWVESDLKKLAKKSQEPNSSFFSVKVLESATHETKDVLILQITIVPQQGLWQDIPHDFKLSIDGYPLQKPKVTLLTKIFHPNFNNGVVQLNTLRSNDYMSTLDLVDMLPLLHNMFIELDPYNAINEEAGELVRTNLPKFVQMAMDAAPPRLRSNSSFFEQNQTASTNYSDLLVIVSGHEPTSYLQQSKKTFAAKRRQLEVVKIKAPPVLSEQLITYPGPTINIQVVTLSGATLPFTVDIKETVGQFYSRALAHIGIKTLVIKGVELPHYMTFEELRVPDNSRILMVIRHNYN